MSRRSPRCFTPDVTGRLTSSPLAAREAMAHVGLPVLSRPELADAETARELLARVRIPVAA